MADTRATAPDAIAERIRAALASVVDPEIRRPITELGMLESVEVDEAGAASVAIRLTIVGCPAATTIETNVRATTAAVSGVTDVDVAVGVMTPEQRAALTERLRGAKRGNPFAPGTLTRVIAVTSGKGGVGKSTVTAGLAVALARRGLAVGVLDADVHGFSIPPLLGLVDADGTAVKPTRVGDLILPPVAELDDGVAIKVISIGMFVDAGTPVAWRGPMLHRTLEQFLTDVHFGDLDVLLLDLPPGTGDVAISLGQLLPNADVLVVTTPQPAAADVAVRSGLVARQTGQRVVGVVETMAPATLPDGTVLDLFGSGGGAAVAARLSDGADAVPLLGSVPISRALREAGDAGIPVAEADPAAVALARIAAALAATRESLAGRRLGIAPR